jgi:hypothetical protein
LTGSEKTNAAPEPGPLCKPYRDRVAGPGAATGKPVAAAVFALPASHMHCLSDKLSNPYAELTLDQSTKFIDRDQANVWKACHIVISAHGDRLWRTQVFFSTNFAIAELHELLDLQGETYSSRAGNFYNNIWKLKFKI